MKSQKNSGLVDRKVADYAAGIVFALIIIAALIVLFGNGWDLRPAPRPAGH